MKVTRHYEHDHVIIYVEEGEMKTCITLDNDLRPNPSPR